MTKQSSSFILSIFLILTFGVFGCDSDSSRGTLQNDSDTLTSSDSDFVSDTDTDTDSDTDTDTDSDTDSDSDSSSTEDTDILNSSRLDNITKTCGTLMPVPVSGGSAGWGSRYWDCCKPHCSWIEHVNNDPSMLARNCDINDVEVAAYEKIEHEYWTEEVTTPSVVIHPVGALSRDSLARPTFSII
ncbi:MAG: hypothetical protein JXR78_07520 [Victivallales bacterium]|nr:hypothetical protein [Victivallales bacterium]